MCFAPLRRAFFRHLNLKKRSTPEVFCTVWLGNGPSCQFFDIWTSKSAPRLGCFACLTCTHTHTQTQSQKNSARLECFFWSSRCQARGCFLSAWFAVHSPIFSSRVAWLGNVLRATRSCAILRHPNFKKRSVAEVFLAFWLGNALGATSRAIFGHPNFKRWFGHFRLKMCFAPQSRAIFRHPNFKKWWRNVVLDILTWKCASRHSGVQFFISLLNSYLCTPTFRPSGTTNHLKNTAIRDFPNILRVRIFFF